MFNSKPIANDHSPSPPNIRYYNNDIEGNCDTIENKETLSSTLYTNLGKSCTINDNALFNNKNDVYEKTIAGTLNVGEDNLENQVNNKCTSEDGKKKIINQLKYLSCQLASSRNRTYNSSDFDITSAGVSVKQVFEKFKNIKVYLIIIFFLTIYFLTQGFFSSFDVCGNIINLVNNNYSQGWLYWIGLFLGLLIPVLILASLFVTSVCGSISSLDKINITDNPAGVDDKIPLGFKRLDNGILLLFLLFLYGFIAVIFTIKRESVGNTFYMIIIGSILFIISIFIYLFYTFTPFFSSGNLDKVNKFEVPLKLFIDQREEVSEITTNQVQIQKIQNVFLEVGITITSFFILFILLGKSSESTKNSWYGNLLNGFFGASAVLVVPIFWIFNLVIALKYFYIYPIILLMFRFIRYACMGLLYVLSDKIDSLKNFMSPNLVEQLENFKNYTPTWNLIGIDFLKSLLNIMGYENIFSESYTNNNSNNKNLSANKYVISPLVSSLFLNLLTDSSDTNATSRAIIQGIICVISIIIASSALWGVYKI